MPDFSDPHFAAPLRLWLLLPVLLALGALAYRASRARARAVASIAATAMVRSLLAAHSPRRRAAKYLLQAAAVALVVLALARPCWGVEKGERAEDAEDVIFLLDTSRSMTARDVAPDRLARAKRAIATFVNMHPSGRVGLVAFAGQSFLQCPPTSDRDIFNETLDEMDTDVIPKPGTDIGGAIDAGYAAFGEVKKGTRRTLVLITDGEDLAGAGVETAKKLGREGVVIHTVGIGGSGFDIAARADGSGGTVTTSLDERTLRDIAGATGGEYFRLGGANDNIGAVEAKLGHVAAHPGTSRRAVERFPVVLALAATVAAVEALLGTRRKDAPRGGLAAYAAAPVVALFLLLPAARADSPDNLFDRGADALRRAEYGEAEGMLKSSLEDAEGALRPLALHNLGQARARAATKVVDKYLAKDPAGPGAAKIARRMENTFADVNDVLDRNAKGDFDPDDAMAIYGKSVQARQQARQQLKAAREAIGDAEGAARKLTRARDDFLSSYELDPTFAASKENAGAIDAYLKRLNATIDKEKAAAEKAAKTIAELKEKLSILRRLLKLGPSQGEGDGDDDEEEEGKKGQSGQDRRTAEQRRQQEGKEGRLNRDEAMAALEQMRPGLRSRLPSSFGKVDPNARPEADRNVNDR